MPYAITHVLAVVILLELFRDYFIKNKKAFPLHYILIGGIAGVLPDLDIAVFYVLSFSGYALNEIHRTFSHNLTIPILFLIIGLLVHGFKSKKLGEHHLKLRNIFFVIAFGIFMHIVLDFLIAGEIMPFYPFYSYAAGLSLVDYFPSLWRSTILPVMEAAIFIIWLISLEVRHKISSFI